MSSTPAAAPSRSRPRRILLALVAVAGVALGFWIFTGMRAESPLPGGERQFISLDDGATWLSDTSGQIAPFDRDGKTAAEVVLYTCDGGKTQWVGYLLRYSPRGKELLAESRKRLASGRAPEPLTALQQETEAKRPGASEWTKLSDTAAYARLLTEAPKCPHPATHAAEPVSP